MQTIRQKNRYVKVFVQENGGTDFTKPLANGS